MKLRLISLFFIINNFDLNFSMSFLKFIDKDGSIYSQEHELALIENLNLSLLGQVPDYKSLKELLNREIKKFIIDHYEKLSDFEIIKIILSELRLEANKSERLNFLTEKYIKRSFAKLLERHNLDINCTNEKGDTLLINLTEDRNLDLIKLILNIKDIDIGFENDWQETALSIAILNQDKDIIKLLVKNSEKAYKSEEKLIKKLKQESTNLELKKSYQKRVLSRIISWRTKNLKNS